MFFLSFHQYQPNLFAISILYFDMKSNLFYTISRPFEVTKGKQHLAVLSLGKGWILQ